MIIDVHAHVGQDCVFDEHFTKEAQLLKHREFHIHASIVQPGSCHDLESVQEQHDVIASMQREYSGQFYGMANPNPHLKDALYEAEVRRCMEQLGFVGIKLHTSAHAVLPVGKDGLKVFALARKLGVPVMVHTGAGIPFANPSNLIPAAEQFPEVKIVIAHCGMMVMAAELPIVMERCSNVYADITWTAGFAVKHWSEQFGAHRFMFGTDQSANTGTELAKVRTSGLSPVQQEWIMHKTARSVFHLPLPDNG